MRVLKFGGSSLANVDRLRAAARIIARHRAQAPTVVVASAMAGVTDALLRAGRAALAGEGEWRTLLAALEDTHRTAYLALWGGVPETFVDLWAALFADAEALAADGGASSASRLEAFSGWGERLVVGLLTRAVLLEGAAAEAFTGEPVQLEGGSASADEPTPSVLATRAWLVPRIARLVRLGGVPVLPGYIARDGSGFVTTLGRNGSDFSATVVAAALGAESVTIFSDVPGIFNADPHIVPGARLLPVLTYAEAREIALLGAKVLHPRTVQPLAHWEIPLYLCSSLDPALPGTSIVPHMDTAVAATLGPRWVVAERVSSDTCDRADSADANLGLREVTALVLSPESQRAAAETLEQVLAEVLSAGECALCGFVGGSGEDVTLRLLAPADRAVHLQRVLHAALEQSDVQLGQPSVPDTCAGRRQTAV